MTVCFSTAAGVELFPLPWVAGTRSVAYFGVVTTERAIARSLLARQAVLEAEEDALLDALGQCSAELGGNAVVGVEVEADPFGEDGRLRLRAFGTAAKLEPLL